MSDIDGLAAPKPGDGGSNLVKAGQTTFVGLTQDAIYSQLLYHKPLARILRPIALIFDQR
jgi:hypothetical protein